MGDTIFSIPMGTPLASLNSSQEVRVVLNQDGVPVSVPVISDAESAAPVFGGGNDADDSGEADPGDQNEDGTATDAPTAAQETFEKRVTYPWKIVLVTKFVARYFNKVDARTHLEAARIFDDTGTVGGDTNSGLAGEPVTEGQDLMWPTSWTVDMETTKRDIDYYLDDEYQYPYPTAEVFVNLQNMLKSPISTLEYYFSLLAAGSQHDLMTMVLLKYGYLYDKTNPNVTAVGIPLDPQKDMCVVGALFDRALCWSHLHDEALE